MSNKVELQNANLLPSNGAILPIVTTSIDTMWEGAASNTVKITLGGSFTQQHADINKNLVPTGAWSHLYGDELDPKLKVRTRSFLLDADQIKVNTNGNSNTAWVGDGNPDYNEIKVSMGSGFKLYVPCVAVFALPNGKFMLMDRRTSHSILVNDFEYTNLICDIYDPSNKPDGLPYTYQELVNDGVFDDFGMTANIKRDLPAGQVKKKDLKNYINQQIAKNRFALDSFGAPDYNDVLKQIDKISGSQGFKKSTRTDLAAEIVNQHDTSNTVKAWLTLKSIKTWMETTNSFVYAKPTKYPDGKLKSVGVHYEIIGASQCAASVKRTAAVAVSNPNTEIRIILHTEVLDAYIQDANYWAKIRSFRTTYNKIKQDISSAYFDGVDSSDNRVKLFGALPAVASIHSDLNKLVYFIGDKGYEDGDTDDNGDVIKYGESMNWQQK